MYSRKVTWLLLSIVVFCAGLTTAVKKDQTRSKPLALNLDKTANDEENSIKPVLEKSDSETNEVVVEKQTKNTTGSINDTIEDTFELLDTLEKDEEGHKSSVAVSKPRPAFIGQVKDLLLNFVRLFGFIPTSNKRKHRNMNFLNETENVIDPTDFYHEQVRTTVGAVLGRPDCIKRAACRAGKYLREIKGKEIILVIMEKVTPSKWQETYRVVKDSAVHSNECHYKCLED